MRSCVVDLARNGSKCDDWEAVVAERDNCYTVRGSTAGRLNLRLAGRLSVHPHCGIRLTHRATEYRNPSDALLVGGASETPPGASRVQQSGNDDSSVG